MILNPQKIESALYEMIPFSSLVDCIASYGSHMSYTKLHIREPKVDSRASSSVRSTSSVTLSGLSEQLVYVDPSICCTYVLICVKKNGE